MVKLIIHGALLGLVFLQVVAVWAVDIENIQIWPMPEFVRNGNQILYLNKDIELKTIGSKYADESGILKEGFSRIIELIEEAHVIDGNFTKLEPSVLLRGINVVISSTNDELEYGTDESYNLTIPNKGSPIFAHLEAHTVYGALHGLQTFSQLCQFNFTSRLIEVHHVPWKIIDQPRFSYRGLLIDTSRHYLPLPVIKQVIESMTYAKLNVLHWHIVDSQSFPLEVPSYPQLWKGAYSDSERYTMDEAADIVRYAQRRGVNVLAEIDVPGHASSWGNGYPLLWPSKNCKEPLDVSNEFTFKLIDGILSDFSKVFKFKFVHLGGDEVNTDCWKLTSHVKRWLWKHNMTEESAYQYFVLRVQKIALAKGYEIINWEETFNNFGDKLSRKTVVHNWLGGDVAPKVVKAGLRCIVSNQNKWYLDHLDALWTDFYSNEPLANIINPKEQKLVLGGEVCMWGEHIDGSDIQQTIWPRAAAAAERLWTDYDRIAKDPIRVTKRLANFRCLLNRRGVAAAPLFGPGRSAPVDPGSCYNQ